MSIQGAVTVLICLEHSPKHTSFRMCGVRFNTSPFMVENHFSQLLHQGCLGGFISDRTPGVESSTQPLLEFWDTQPAQGLQTL